MKTTSNKDNQKHEDDLKNEGDIKNEDDLKNEDNLENWPSPTPTVGAKATTAFSCHLSVCLWEKESKKSNFYVTL